MDISSTFTHTDGALESGNDIETLSMTVQNAIQHAASLPNCIGFTFENPQADAGGNVVQIFFKSSKNMFNADNSEGWQTYTRQSGDFIYLGKT